ncbi:putative bifunctional diguanylate cyclase/phosphodiesterase [Actinoplanes sp. NPDC020271]|uniref:putative bifunctional diguanylate cyclase/phosphodiesterase n=1 Tax=Actinoplanes sp. NPDC020271 TaxID=3363896 RepID=UPI0037B36DE8
MVLGTVMWQGYRRDASEQGRRQGLAQARVIAEMAVAPSLDGANLEDGLTTSQLEGLRRATGLAVYHGSVLRLRVRGFAGQVVFSDDGSTGGGLPVSDPDFRAATTGASRVKVIGSSGHEVIRVVQPLVAGASGQALGVLELYLPFQEIAAQMREQLNGVTERIALGLAALYLVLALLAWWTTRSLSRYAARQEYNATHDMLTGLPNRAEYRNRAEAVLATAGRDGGHGAVVLLDLNRFKEVNDTLGHHAGDELLRVVSARMRDGLDEGDMLARFGGDEFAMLLPGRDAVQAVAVLERVRAAVAEELVLDGVPLSMEASFGIALYPEHGLDLQTLKLRADAAMYQGKRGTEDIVVFTGGTAGHPHQWLKIQAELRHALERDELVLRYQPKVGLPGAGISGVEALVRWQHPERGLLPPGEFLPAAEHSGLIAPLTEWVLRRALADQAGWTATGQDWTLSVNVSARNLDAPGFVGYVAALLAETGTRPDRLILEVTETALAGDAATAVRVVKELGALGVGISVDDFGTGYTSLSHLRGLPISEIKIDRAFVADVDGDPQSQAIVRSVIELAHGLGSRVTAEGVETVEIHRWLVDAGCDEAQGYLYGRPVPWPQVTVEPIAEPITERIAR